MFNQCISTTCSFRTLQEVTGVIKGMMLNVKKEFVKKALFSLIDFD